VGYERSEFRVFSNVLVHVNGAKLETFKVDGEEEAAELQFNEDDPHLYFSVIDGQHRINGAYFAVSLRRKEQPSVRWELPAQVFLDLDKPENPPRFQAQIFIDVNYYQKKVDRSLVADLFPTTRSGCDPIDDKERAQDIGRKLMLERGPLVGMIQIPGIRFGVKDVVTLATLNAAIEDHLQVLRENGIQSLEAQTDFLAQCLTAWLEASGRFEKKKGAKITEMLDPSNVAYQGRVLVSILTLIPAMMWQLRSKGIEFNSPDALKELTSWLKNTAKRTGLLERGVFITRDKFKRRGFLGSGGIARFRDLLWASIEKAGISRLRPEKLEKLAKKARARIHDSIARR
jgi:DGQHR domain-containing protein